MVIVCEERKTIKKNQENWYFNEIKCKIDNLVWSVLKSKYVK